MRSLWWRREDVSDARIGLPEGSVAAGDGWVVVTGWYVDGWRWCWPMLLVCVLSLFKVASGSLLCNSRAT